MSCRKNFVSLGTDELNWLADALNALYTSGAIHDHGHHHEEYFSNGIHRGPAFLPWHRHMMLLFRQALQAVDARVTLPYWEWTRADSQDLDAEPWKSFFGGRNNTGGRFDHWDYTRGSTPLGQLPSLDDVINFVLQTSDCSIRFSDNGRTARQTAVRNERPSIGAEIRLDALDA